MTILVTGANGQLGNEMRIVAAGSADRWIFSDVRQAEGVATTVLDICDRDAVLRLCRAEGVGVIVNCAAYTDVDAAEANEALAERLNAGAAENLALAMKELGGLLVHISTDYVFGKEPYNKPCREDQKGTPTGVYGLTKLHGEQKITASGCEHAIIRTSWLYSEFGKNFCKTMLSLTASKPSVKVVFDQCGTPTYALGLANAISLIIKKYGEGGWTSSGVYNYSDEGVCSWFDFAKAIYALGKEAGLLPPDADCDILPCHSGEFPSRVSRPSYSVLDKTLIKQTFGVDGPFWTDAL